MTDNEKRRMALLEATLKEVRRIAEAAKTDPSGMDLDDAFEGQLGRQWRRVRRQIDNLV